MWFRLLQTMKKEKEADGHQLPFSWLDVDLHGYSIDPQVRKKMGRKQ
jgi:hypothetical protein